MFSQQSNLYESSKYLRLILNCCQNKNKYLISIYVIFSTLLFKWNTKRSQIPPPHFVIKFSNGEYSNSNLLKSSSLMKNIFPVCNTKV